MAKLFIGFLFLMWGAACAALLVNGYAIYQVRGAGWLGIYVFTLACVAAIHTPRLLDLLAGSRRRPGQFPRHRSKKEVSK